MRIELQGVGKRFGRNWIFKDLNYTIDPGARIAIVGSNGSGKSTLLQIISTFLNPSQGSINFNPSDEHPHLRMNFCAPYFDVIDSYTLQEFLVFHSKFKRPLIPIPEMIRQSHLKGEEHKFIKDMSSGMKQRIKLMIAFLFHSEVILLDEPTTNLDQNGYDWYDQLLSEIGGRTLLIASNQAREYGVCQDLIEINQYKRQ